MGVLFWQEAFYFGSIAGPPPLILGNSHIVLPTVKPNRASSKRVK